MCRVVVCVVRVGGFFFFVGGFVFMRCRALVCSEVDVVTSCFAGFRVQMSGRECGGRFLSRSAVYTFHHFHAHTHHRTILYHSFHSPFAPFGDTTECEDDLTLYLSSISAAFVHEAEVVVVAEECTTEGAAAAETGAATLPRRRAHHITIAARDDIRVAGCLS